MLNDRHKALCSLPAISVVLRFTTLPASRDAASKCMVNDKRLIKKKDFEGSGHDYIEALRPNFLEGLTKL